MPRLLRYRGLLLAGGIGVSGGVVLGGNAGFVFFPGGGLVGDGVCGLVPGFGVLPGVGEALPGLGAALFGIGEAVLGVGIALPRFPVCPGFAPELAFPGARPLGEVGELLAPDWPALGPAADPAEPTDPDCLISGKASTDNNMILDEVTEAVGSSPLSKSERVGLAGREVMLPG
jgi:hypothetical protein